MTEYKKNILVYLVAVIVLILIGFTALFIGSSYINPIDVISYILNNNQISASTAIIISEIRLPRIILAFIVGAGLAVAGSVFQAIIRNPMVDPYIIGISAGAGTGVMVALFLGIEISVLNLSSIPVFAFIGAVSTVFIVYQLAKVGKKLPVLTFLLAGVAMSFILNSVMSFLMVLRTENLQQLVYWLMGSLAGSSWSDIQMVLPYFLAALAVIVFYLKDLNILLLGEESAAHLGLNVERTKIILLGSASLITASVVSVSGSIGFIGLVVPHITRMIIGPDHRKLIPLTALFGGGFLLVADTAARTIMAPMELPVGIITALAGGPYFIHLLRNKSKNIW
ncbi:iron complex transport system permease protein [Halanaerobium congolense]|jgi:iron complex transport system permease protein|uniref:Iron complex transport system permease protein n=1 Tax=Halanaerobium congolense TaxID=54121 RepID=A0A1G6SDJ6_9FIRM|nr:iron chelate uptake ABC transporter family permease subunit [Halanaerobium congolense]KXS49537.1 MAG: iron complex transport system permease protein [Halanaerobium sp. T82-1]OEG63564.1 MAG: iron ABC transporter [Halanaerobium sp. MDAL1]PUU91549.1 MAG: iron complex transport system permease protein [Halanaerobium sp.]PXV62738.1 iron complex transport system permease protein [Halanaerobium congolense]TDP13528.1 iron complex transport system permease protein [Halanaerobium congolense]